MLSRRRPSDGLSVPACSFGSGSLSCLLLSQFVLGAALGPALVSLLSQLAIVPLQVLQAFLLHLGLLDRLGDEKAAVRALARMGGQCCLCGLLSRDRVKDGLFLADIPIPYLIKVEVAHVVALDFANFVAVLVNFTPGKVLLAESVRTEVVIPDQAIRFVRERHLASQLVVHRAHEDSAEVVIVLVPTYFSSICKFDLLEAETVNSARCESSINLVLKVPIHIPGSVGAFRNEVTSRWMVSCLFHVNFRAVLAVALVGFAEDGVERLDENRIVEVPTKVC